MQEANQSPEKTRLRAAVCQKRRLPGHTEQAERTRMGIVVSHNEADSTNMVQDYRKGT